MIIDLDGGRFVERGYYFPTHTDVGAIKTAILKAGRNGIDDLCTEVVNDYGCVGLSNTLVEQICSTARTHLGCPDARVVIVGSAKVGCKLISNDATRPRYSGFSEQSDIDCAVISSPFFDQIWEDAFSAATKSRPWHIRHRLDPFIFKGWLRPDKLDFGSTWRAHWFDAVAAVNRDVCPELKLSAGLYKGDAFLLRYQMEAFRVALRNLELGE
ncbi:hypothetical protein [Marinicauda pacifica]|uniref:hypothetical protein n=1 Tax=Marinicauda pacifica TaxID=1133559 RepID=UPI0035C79D6D